MFSFLLQIKKSKNTNFSYFTQKVAYSGKKLASCFSIKDKTKFEHKHNVAYNDIKNIMIITLENLNMAL